MIAHRANRTDIYVCGLIPHSMADGLLLTALSLTACHMASLTPADTSRVHPAFLSG